MAATHVAGLTSAHTSRRTYQQMCGIRQSTWGCYICQVVFYGSEQRKYLPHMSYSTSWDYFQNSTSFNSQTGTRDKPILDSPVARTYSIMILLHDGDRLEPTIVTRNSPATASASPIVGGTALASTSVSILLLLLLLLAIAAVSSTAVA